MKNILNRIYIFDIDNTLCDTWPSLKSKKNYFIFRFVKENIRVFNLPHLEGMVNCVKRRLSRKNVNVFFLSARHWSLWPVTYLYLLIKIGCIFPWRLILVPKAKLKIDILKKFMLENGNHITMIDDLSYNTENGKTLFYNDVIKYILKNSKKIRYINKNHIDTINSSHYIHPKSL